MNLNKACCNILLQLTDLINQITEQDFNKPVSEDTRLKDEKFEYEEKNTSTEPVNNDSEKKTERQSVNNSVE